MLQRRNFYSKKKRVFCSNARFWTFNPSKCVGHLRRQNCGCDAGSARVRMGKKRAVPRPMMPHDGTPCRGVTPGLV